MFESPFHFFQHHYGHPGDVEMVIGAAKDTLHAIEAIESGDRDSALELWKRVDGNALLELWNASARTCRELGPRWNLERPQPTASPDKPAGASIAKKVYQRDGYRCRYCSSPVFTRNKGSRILQLIGAFPEETRGLTLVDGSLRGSGKSGAICNADYAKFLWSLAAPDHVFPRSLGGRTDMDNLVTSCSGCNYSKMDLTLEQMDVRPPT